MSDAKKNRRRSDDSACVADGDERFLEQVRDMLEEEGVLESGASDALREQVEETRRREERREHERQESTRAAHDWKTTLREVGETLREVKVMLSRAEGPEDDGEVAEITPTPVIEGTDSIH